MINPHFPDSRPASTTSGAAVAALILGIVAILAAVPAVFPIVGFFFAAAAVPTGVLAVIFGAVSRSRLRRTGGQGAGMAMTGIVLGALAAAGAAVVSVVWLAVGAFITTLPEVPEAQSVLVYEIEGTAAEAEITYSTPLGERNERSRVPRLDDDAIRVQIDPEEVHSYLFQAVTEKQGASLTCRITVDGEVVSENSSVTGYVSCFYESL